MWPFIILGTAVGFLIAGCRLLYLLACKRHRKGEIAQAEEHDKIVFYNPIDDVSIRQQAALYSVSIVGFWFVPTVILKVIYESTADGCSKAIAFVALAIGYFGFFKFIENRTDRL